MKRLVTLMIFLLSVVSAIAQQQPKENTFDWYLWDAHQRGVTQTQINEGLIQGTANLPLPKALRYTTLVVAEQVGEAVTHDDRSVTTFRKYHTVEILTHISFLKLA